MQPIIYRQPRRQHSETVERVGDLPQRLRATIPDAMDMEVMDADHHHPRIAREVERALAISIALVVIVVFAFLRSGRATIIPAISCGVAAGHLHRDISLLGYSLNNPR